MTEQELPITPEIEVGKQDEVVGTDTFNAVKSDLSNRLADKTNAGEILEEILRTSDSELIPWEEIPLPSRGLWYDNKVPGGVVRVRAMGAFADKILATQRLAQTGQSIDYLLEHCVQYPNEFKASDLLAGDRIYLLYVLRGITHGNKYEFLLTCPHCGVASTYTYDLNELGNTITRGNPDLGLEPFKVVLPYLSTATGREVFVRVRFLRGTDTSQIARRQRFKKKVAPAAPRAGKKQGANNAVIDDSLTENLNLVIVDFGVADTDGMVNDSAKIKALVEKMHSSDTAAIREFLRENSPGIDTTISITCPDCGGEFKTELPITENFFRPTQR